MSTLFDASYVISILLSRQWKVINILDKLDPMIKAMKGISLHGLSPNGYVLSVQAGFGARSSPAEPAPEYVTVEVAVWADFGDGKKAGPFIRDDSFGTDSEVIGFVTLDELINIIDTIENWSETNPPGRFMRRTKTRWGDLCRRS